MVSQLNVVAMYEDACLYVFVTVNLTPDREYIVIIISYIHAPAHVIVM